MEGKVGIPSSLEETVSYLKKISSGEVSDIGKMRLETFIACSHNNLGRWIRNNWGLWSEKGSLFEELKKLGFTHADDMSEVILRNFYHTVKGERFDIKSYADECKKHWEKYSQ